MEVSGRKQEGSDGISTGMLCDPCNDDDEKEIAMFYCTVCNEFLCYYCTRTHRRVKVSKHHQLLDGDSMPTQKFSSSEESMCTKHNEKLAEYYCKTHDDCCCSVCATLEHKQCEVEYIEDIAAEFDKSKEFKSLMSEITDFTQLLQNMKKMALKKMHFVGHINANFVSEVKKFRSEMNQILDSLEQNTLIKAQIVKDKDTKSTVSASTTCDDIIAWLQEISSNMEKQKKYKQQRQLVISAKKAQSQLKQYDSLTEKLTKLCTIREYTFGSNENIFQYLKAANNIGTLHVEVFW